MFISPSQALAQEAYSDPNVLYYSQIENNRSFYDALIAVEQVHGLAVAAEIATFVCSPDPDPECEGSAIDLMWIDFLSYIGEGASVFETVVEMIDAGGDEALLTAIAVYWCSPDPEPGEGCGDDPATGAWFDFVTLMNQGNEPADVIAEIGHIYGEYEYIASAIGAKVCGHPTCFAGYDDVELAVEEPEQIAKAKPGVDNTSSTRRYVGAKIERSKSTRSVACIIGIFGCANN